MSTTLLEDTRRLVDIASVSHNEAEIAGLVEAELRAVDHLDVVRIGHNVVAQTALGRPTRVILAGHLDTVPPAGNEIGRVDGTRLYGVGSSDMKGGLAVMLHLARHLADPGVDLSFIFYTCEEVGREDSGLLEIERANAELLVADVALVLEPTTVAVEAGCQGVMRCRVTTGGVRAHAARPWMGSNAIHRLAPLLARVAQFPERRPVIDGCEYHETLQATRVEGGVASNVVPDAARVDLTHRYAPDRTGGHAVEALRTFLDPVLDAAAGDTFEVLDNDHPAAPPSLRHPILAALVAESGRPPVAKLGWTDVGFFAERGVPAANFGPGDSLVAHSAGEFVEANDLDEAAARLTKVLASAGRVA